MQEEVAHPHTDATLDPAESQPARSDKTATIISNPTDQARFINSVTNRLVRARGLEPSDRWRYGLALGLGVVVPLLGMEFLGSFLALTPPFGVLIMVGALNIPFGRQVALMQQAKAQIEGRQLPMRDAAEMAEGYNGRLTNLDLTFGWRSDAMRMRGNAFSWSRGDVMKLAVPVMAFENLNVGMAVTEARSLDLLHRPVILRARARSIAGLARVAPLFSILLIFFVPQLLLHGASGRPSTTATTLILIGICIMMPLALLAMVFIQVYAAYQSTVIYRYAKGLPLATAESIITRKPSVWVEEDSTRGEDTSTAASSVSQEPAMPSAPTPLAPTAPVAGWYEDPMDASLLRWWDGAEWTAHTAPAHEVH